MKFTKCTPGCIYSINNKELLDKMLLTNHFIHIKTYYTSKKWWEFWKHKKPILYDVMCIK